MNASFVKMYFEKKYPLQLQSFWDQQKSVFIKWNWYSDENFWFDELLQHLVQCTDSTAWTNFPKKNDSLEKPVRFWFRLHFLSRFSSTFPRSLFDESCNAIADKTRNVIDFNFISPCIANRWVWMMERVGRRRGFWKGERPSANKFLCKIPNFAFDCPDQCGIGKQFAFVKNIFFSTKHFAVNKDRNHTNHFCILKIILQPRKCVLFRILPQISIKSRCPMRFHDNTCWHSSGSALDWPCNACQSNWKGIKNGRGIYPQ